jgi:hypothetical protein
MARYLSGKITLFRSYDAGFRSCLHPSREFTDILIKIQTSGTNNPVAGFYSGSIITHNLFRKILYYMT